MRFRHPSRRQFLATSTTALALAPSLAKAGPDKAEPPKDGPLLQTQSMPDTKVLLPTDGLIHSGAPKRLAAIVGAFWRNSHADNIILRFMEGYAVAGQMHRPYTKVISLFLDKTPDDDIGKAVATHY